jgi:Fe-Mn family superoxide dismutase
MAMDKSRRNFLLKGSLLTLAGIGSQLISNQVFSAIRPAVRDTEDPPFSLPELPYATDALEPFIDKMTMEIHHAKHHQAYVDNLNKAMDAGNIKATLEELIRKISSYPATVRNNAGGHWNHSFFWKLMGPGNGSSPNGAVAESINETFGTFDAFKTQFEEAAMKRFGSGWAWLVMNSDKKLSIGSTPNQDNPLMDVSDFKGTPILGVDVWEHAYYLKFQNKRADYLKSWWNVVDWSAVNKNLEASQKN